MAGSKRAAHNAPMAATPKRVRSSRASSSAGAPSPHVNGINGTNGTNGTNETNGINGINGTGGTNKADLSTPTGCDPAVQPLRRSGRARKQPVFYHEGDNGDFDDPISSPLPAAKRQKVTPEKKPPGSKATSQTGRGREPQAASSPATKAASRSASKRVSKSGSKASSKPAHKLNGQDKQGQAQDETQAGIQVDEQIDTMAEITVDTKFDDQMDARVESKANDQIEDKVDIQPGDQVEAQTEAQDRAQTGAQTGAQIEAHIDNHIDNHLDHQAEKSVGSTNDSKPNVQKPVDSKEAVIDKSLQPSDPAPAVPRDKQEKGKLKEGETRPLDETLSKISPEEVMDFEGWVELESEPAQFEHILRTLGVSDVVCREVFAFDQSLFATLPHPIHGLIFLFECEKEDISDSKEIIDVPNGVYYANQIASNSCASVALINILLNGNGVDLGPKLESFKRQTMGLLPPERGQHLADNTFIRAAHNSFARRIDLLAEDLAAKNDFDDNAKAVLSQAKGKGRVTKRRRPAKARKEADQPSAKHYVAYVPVNGRIWELDGLEGGAIDLGQYVDEWTDTVLPLLIERATTISSPYVTLLALCQSPLVQLRQDLELIIAKLVLLQEEIELHPHLLIDRVDYTTWVDGTMDQDLADLGLTVQDVKRAYSERLTQEFVDQVQGSWLTKEHAVELRDQLEKKLRAKMAEYGTEADEIQSVLATAEKRRADWTPMVHAFLKKLADAGKLEELCEDVAG